MGFCWGGELQIGRNRIIFITSSNVRTTSLSGFNMQMKTQQQQFIGGKKSGCFAVRALPKKIFKDGNFEYIL